MPATASGAARRAGWQCDRDGEISGTFQAHFSALVLRLSGMDPLRRLHELEREIELRTIPPGIGRTEPTCAGALGRAPATWIDAGLVLASSALAALVISSIARPDDVLAWMAGRDPSGVAEAALRRSFLTTALGAMILWHVPEALFGRSLGKRLLGLTVTALDGTSALRAQLLGRAALKLLGPMLMVVGALADLAWLGVLGLGVLTLLLLGATLALGPGGRALHDRMSGTAVLRTHLLVPLLPLAPKSETPKDDVRREPAPREPERSASSHEGRDGGAPGRPARSTGEGTLSKAHDRLEVDVARAMMRCTHRGSVAPSSGLGRVRS